MTKGVKKGAKEQVKKRFPKAYAFQRASGKWAVYKGPNLTLGELPWILSEGCATPRQAWEAARLGGK